MAMSPEDRATMVALVNAFTNIACAIAPPGAQQQPVQVRDGGVATVTEGLVHIGNALYAVADAVGEFTELVREAERHETPETPA